MPRVGCTRNTTPVSYSTVGSRELRSVTVRFQNKRQAERKFAPSCSQPSSSLMCPKPVLHQLHPADSHSRLRTQSRTGRPSLDGVASGSKCRVRPPTLLQKLPSSSGPGYTLWANMLPSPIGPPSNSPEAPCVFIEFGRKGKLKGTKTLEWTRTAAMLPNRKRHSGNESEAAS